MRPEDDTFQKIMDYAICTLGAVIWLHGIFTISIYEMLIGIGIMVLSKP